MSKFYEVERYGSLALEPRRNTVKQPVSLKQKGKQKEKTQNDHVEICEIEGWKCEKSFIGSPW